jgi:hypothetical protein
MLQFPEILADCSLWLCPIIPLRIGVYVNTSHSSFDIQMFSLGLYMRITQHQ